MVKFEVQNLLNQLEVAKLDNSAGIKLAHLSGDDMFSFYAAELRAGSMVNAHYHAEGIEIYHIIKGRGEMCIGGVKIDAQVAWNPVFEVKAGDCFTVKENEAHQLRNHGEENLVVVFGSSHSHVTTDRFVVQSNF